MSKATNVFIHTAAILVSRRLNHLLRTITLQEGISIINEYSDTSMLHLMPALGGIPCEQDAMVPGLCKTTDDDSNGFP